jgi:hypothetical protein
MIKACPEPIEIGAVPRLPIDAPAGAATAPVVLSYAKAWPLPFAVVVKMPGDTGTTVTFCGAEVPLLRVTTMLTVPRLWPGSTSKGSCALIWFGPTKYSPAGIPFNVTDVTSLNAVGSGIALATEVEAAKFVPKMDTMEPGAAPPMV